jgi:hypothetical protein
MARGRTETRSILEQYPISHLLWATRIYQPKISAGNVRNARSVRSVRSVPHHRHAQLQRQQTLKHTGAGHRRSSSGGAAGSGRRGWRRDEAGRQPRAARRVGCSGRKGKAQHVWQTVLGFRFASAAGCCARSVAAKRSVREQIEAAPLAWSEGRGLWQLAPSPAQDGRDSADRHKRSDAAVREGRTRARHVARRKKIQLKKP